MLSEYAFSTLMRAREEELNRNAERARVANERLAKLWLMLWRGDPDAAASQYRAWRSSMANLGETEMQTLLGGARVLAEIALAQGKLDEAWVHASVLFSDVHRTLPIYDLPLLAVAANILARRRAAHGSPELSASPATPTELNAAESALRALLERLFISAKTASVHVSAILRKLGAASHTEAVFLAAHEPAEKLDRDVYTVAMRPRRNRGRQIV